MKQENYIILYRKLLEWQWYNDSKMVHLFIHLLLKANHAPGMAYGIEVGRGQRLTGINALQEETRISKQSLRTCLKKLKSTNEITIKSTNKYSIITICKYDIYQISKVSINKENNNQSNIPSTFNQQATNIQSTTNNKNNNNKKNKNKDVFTPPSLEEFKQYFTENGFGEELAARAWKGYEVAQWHDSQGSPVKNWKQKCQNVWFRDQNRPAGSIVKKAKVFRLSDYFSYSDYVLACGPEGITPLSQQEFEEAVKPKAKVA